jgi:type VI protein secretion system component VasK
MELVSATNVVISPSHCCTLMTPLAEVGDTAVSAAQYGIWIIAAVWLTLSTALAVRALRNASRLQRKLNELSEQVSRLETAEQRRFLQEINTPKEIRRRQRGDAKKSLVAGQPVRVVESR